MAGRFEVPEGMTVQAFCFALDLTREQTASVRRQFGGRRYAFNWAVRTMKNDLDAYHAGGTESPAPSASGLRKRWNAEKHAECVDVVTGEPWWPEISKEAFADGIAGAATAYWSWQASRAGKREGRRMGFPRFKKKGRDRDRVTFTTGAIRVEPDRRHVTLPRIGTVRAHESTRRLERLIAKGRGRILAVTVSRKGTRIVAAFRVLIARPRQPHVKDPDSVVGVDVGVRRLATVGAKDGTVLERVPNPRPLESVLRELRRLSRERSRRVPGSRRYKETQEKLARLHRRAADIRAHHVHVLTTRLAKTHGTVAAEGLDVAGMLRQKGLPGARARRRGLSDSPWQNREGNCGTRPHGTAPAWWRPTAGTRRRKPAAGASTCRTSAGRSTGPATGRLPDETHDYSPEGNGISVDGAARNTLSYPAVLPGRMRDRIWNCRGSRRSSPAERRASGRPPPGNWPNGARRC